MKTRLKNLKINIIAKGNKNKKYYRKENQYQHEIVKLKIFNLSKKALFRYQINILLRGYNSHVHTYTKGQSNSPKIRYS